MLLASLWHVATPAEGYQTWLAFRFYHREKARRRILQSLMYVSRLVSHCGGVEGETNWSRGGNFSPGFFSPALENQYCLLVNTFCHLDHLQTYTFPARRLWGEKVPNCWMTVFSHWFFCVCLLVGWLVGWLVYPLFLGGILSFLEVAPLDTRNINSPSALAPNLHPPPMPSCLSHDEIW